MIQAEGLVTVSIEADSKGMHIGSQLRNIKKEKENGYSTKNVPTAAS